MVMRLYMYSCTVQCKFFILFARLLNSIFCEHPPTCKYMIGIIYPGHYSDPSAILTLRSRTCWGLSIQREVWRGKRCDKSLSPSGQWSDTWGWIMLITAQTSRLTSGSSFQSWISALERKTPWRTARPRNPRRCPFYLQHWGHLEMEGWRRECLVL